MTILLLLLGGAGLLTLVLIVLYNRLVRLRNMVREGWSGIDVQLKRRANLIPNLVETVKGYMGHERNLLETVTELRSQSMQAGDLGEKQRVENALTGGLARLFAVAEGYPELKANQNFMDLQNQLEGTENRINVARQRYNRAVEQFNGAIRKFPYNLTNSLILHLERKEYFKAESGAQQAPKIKF